MYSKIKAKFILLVMVSGVVYFTGCGGSEVKMGGGTVTYNGNTISLDVDSQDKALVSKTARMGDSDSYLYLNLHPCD